MGMDEDELMMLALDAGAADVEIEDGEAIVYTDPNELSTVRDALEAAGCKFFSAERALIPTNTVSVTDEETLTKVQNLLDMLDDNDDTQNVYHNAELPEEEEEE